MADVTLPSERRSLFNSNASSDMRGQHAFAVFGRLLFEQFPVSLPIDKGSSVPCASRKSQMACVIARMCDSVKVPVSGEPLWPLVPKITIWLRSLISGRRATYSCSSRAKSTSSFFGAGRPARAEIASFGPAVNVLDKASPPRFRLRIQRWCDRSRTFRTQRCSK